MTYLAEQDADTPLARWRLEEPSGFAFAADVGGVNLAGTPANITRVIAGTRPPWTAGGWGVGTRFVNARLTGTGAAVAGWMPQTVEVLVNLTSVPGTGSLTRQVLYRTDTTGALPLLLMWNIDNTVGNRGRLGFGWYTGSAYVSVSAPAAAVTVGTHHIVGVYDGATTLTLYVDGVSVASATVAARGAPTVTASTINIGALNDGSSSIAGTVFDVALYNTGLSAGRVAAHYQASREGGIALTGSGDPDVYFDGAEGAAGTSSGPGPDLSTGGDMAFRASVLDPTVPVIATFAPHPGDPAQQAAPWFIREGFGDGSTFAGDDHSTWIYTPGGAIERVIGSVRCTRADADFAALAAACEPNVSNPGEWGPSWRGEWGPTQQDWDIHASVGAWPATIRWAQNLYLAWQRTGPTVTTAGDIALYWSNIVVIHRRYNYAGGPVTAQPSITVRELVHDLMGRGFNDVVEFDPERVAPGTPWRTRIDHAAWWDGVSAREVLAYAETYAPGMWWTITEPGITGLPKFAVGRWDGPVRYVFRSADVELSGGGNDLANRCLVKYIGTTYGNTKTTWVAEVRANVRGLAEAGVTRTMTLDVTGEGLMATETARARGVSALRQAAQESTAGKVTVHAPIYDMVQGRMVEPWEVEGGSPVIVADAPLSFSRSTSLAESVGADGVSVFRARSVSYEASSNTATVTLDGGARSLIGRLKIEATPRRYDLSTVRG